MCCTASYSPSTHEKLAGRPTTGSHWLVIWGWRKKERKQSQTAWTDVQVRSYEVMKWHCSQLTPTQYSQRLLLLAQFTIRGEDACTSVQGKSVCLLFVHCCLLLQPRMVSRALIYWLWIVWCEHGCWLYHKWLETWFHASFSFIENHNCCDSMALHECTVINPIRTGPTMWASSPHRLGLIW